MHPDINVEDKIKEIYDNINALEPSKNILAFELLKEIKTEDELHTLFEFVKDKTFKAKFYVIKHLGKFDYEISIKDLIEFFYDESKLIQKEAEISLSHIKSDLKYDYLLPLINSGNLSTRLYSIGELGKGEKVFAVIPLLEIIHDENFQIRVDVINALRLIGDYRSDRTVIKLIRDPDPLVRYAASFYCGSRKIKESCENLFHLLGDEHLKIRACAVWALGEIGCKKYIYKMKEFLKKEICDEVKYELLKALSNLPSAEAMKDVPADCIPKWHLTTLKKESLEEADICIFAEGSYPFVSGGVSAWLDGLLRYFNDIKFSIVHLGASRKELKEFKYSFPGNVIYFNELYIYDLPASKGKRQRSSRDIEKCFDFFYNLILNINNIDEKSLRSICTNEALLNIEDLYFSEEAWTFFKKIYNKYVPHIPFLEFIWSYRSIILPLYNIMNSQLPPAKLYYPIVTGYAGLAAVLAKLKYNKPVVLTEHGIYHRERAIEIEHLSWIYEEKHDGLIAGEIFTGLKKIWIDKYRLYSSLAYKFADKITTLHMQNFNMQVQAGADPRKMTIIPNGIDVDLYKDIKKEALSKKDVFTVGFIGRVVEIKDVKAFIKAARMVLDEMPGEVRFFIMGPYDEESEYAEECFALVKILYLEDSITFTGNVDLKEYLKEIDVVALTSISEGQPISIMEAMSVGIPCVATNVGACKELLYGKDAVDEKLGECGFITNVRSPAEVANALLKILNDKQLRDKMSRAGKERINRFYKRSDVYEKYRKVFNEFLR